MVLGNNGDEDNKEALCLPDGLVRSISNMISVTLLISFASLATRRLFNSLSSWFIYIDDIPLLLILPGSTKHIMHSNIDTNDIKAEMRSIYTLGTEVSSSSNC